jgi:hypothetical protein
MILGREPVAIAALIAIAINLALTFGLKLTAEQVSLINALVIGVLMLIARANVTTTASPVLAAGTEVRTPSGSTAVVSPVPPGELPSQPSSDGF